jgi:nitrite reductase/ring-hydroxylating ferredoxin subunit
MSDCGNRREFLQRAGGCFVGALAALGLPGADLSALPVTTISGERAGSERGYPIPEADSVSIDREEQVILVRYQGRMFAFSLACPHQNAAVKWVAADHRFQCSRHDSKYQPDGRYTSGRATRDMDRFAIRKEGGSVIVDFERFYRSDQDPAGWASASVAVG